MRRFTVQVDQLAAMWLVYLNGRNMRKDARERVFGGVASAAADKFLRFVKKDGFKPSASTGGARALPSAKEVQLELFVVKKS